jgi:CheY-like chemotaxis protein
MSNTILAVDDYPETLEFLKSFLTKFGYEVTTVETGEEALDLLQVKLFDLVLLDLMLPKVDGFEVCRRIKADPKTQNIPVITITAYDVPDIISRCMAAGASDVVLKPFDVSKLMTVVKKYLPV